MSEEELNKDKQERLIIAASTTGTRLTPADVKHFLQINEELEKEKYILKDKIRAKIEYYKTIDNTVGIRVLEKLLEE